MTAPQPLPQTDPMRSLAISATLLLALSACGGGDEPSAATTVTETVTSDTTSSEASDPTSEPTAETTSPPADLTSQETAQAWIDAFAAADGPGTCALQTPAYTKRDLNDSIEQGIIKKGTTCEDGVVQGFAFAKAFGIDFTKAELTPIDDDGQTAHLDFTIPGTDPSVITVVKVDGIWLIDGSE